MLEVVFLDGLICTLEANENEDNLAVHVIHLSGLPVVNKEAVVIFDWKLVTLLTTYVYQT